MSDSSDLSSAPSEDELELELSKKDGILKFFPKVPKPASKPKEEESPPRKQRAPSPEHAYCLADNPDIAFIVMFRSRFTEAFPKSLANFGPQELERDVVDSVPGDRAEHFLCALLGLLLNRKQDVKPGHYNRALEEAVQTHKSQWAKDWESRNPLLGGATFTTMSPTERLTLLRTMIMWSLASSDAIKSIITTSYKQGRHEDDLNQPLSIQPWGSDGDRRRYYLIEGLDDTHFRVYRESNYTGIKRTWWSVAGDIDELKVLAEKLIAEDGGQKARLLSTRMLAAVPRFEATEEKRKRREYRQSRKEQFKRPEPGFSMYEGRTRGKRMKYTFSDEEDEYSDSTTAARRSTRNTGTHTPAEPAAPTVTLSGRQVKARQGGTYGESMLSGQVTTVEAVNGAGEDSEDEIGDGRPRRAAANSHTTNGRGPKGGRHIDGYNNVDEMTSDEEGDASEQDYGDDEEDEHVSLASEADEPDEESDEDAEMEETEKDSLVVKLPIKTPTPERKTTIKLRLSPQKDNQQPKLTASENGIATSTSTAPKETIGPVTANGEISSKPVSIPLSPTAPLSPLAFRGSPDKPQAAFPQSVDVRGS